MSNLNSHQEYKKGYKVPDGEEGFYHILFVDIKKQGKRTRDVPVVQKYKGKEWAKVKTSIEKWDIKATGHDEFSVLHDPTYKPPVEVKQKPGPKPKTE